jgi:trehalose utilization protein
MGFEEPMFLTCYQNVIIDIYLNGGEIVFGSMGWKREDGSIHYEFGGEEYLTWNDFKV